MKKILLITLASLSVSVFAGNEKGNGGTVLECGDRVVLADFEEVKIRVGLRGKINIQDSSESIEEQLDSVVSKLRDINPVVADDVQEGIKNFNNNVYQIKDDYEWTITPDIGPFPLPKGCSLRNTVMYIDNGPIEMNMNLYNKLSNTHKAGIIIHEVVYKMMRERGVEGSAVPARRLTAMLFAHEADQEILKSLITRFLARKKNQIAIFYDANELEDSKKDYYHIFVEGVNTRILFSSKIRSDSMISGGTSEIMLPTYKMNAGDFLSIYLRVSGMRGSVANVNFNLMTNKDPKENRSKAKYQELIESKLFSFELKTGYADANFFFGVLSRKMDKYLSGEL